MAALGEMWTFIWMWYNLPFTLSIFGCLVLSSIQFLGVLGDDFDFDGDADVDVDVDMDADVDADIDHDLDGADLAEGGPLTYLLHFMGVGQAPLVIVLLLFTAAFGLSGWLANSVVIELPALQIRPVWVGIWAGAFLVASIVSSRLGRSISRVLPSLSTTASTRDQLVGQRAKVISPQVDTSYGQVRVRDAGGTLLTVFAVTPHNRQPIVRDTEVVLVDFDQQRKLYTVVPLDV